MRAVDTDLLVRLLVQDADVVVLALEHFRARPAQGFSDCLVLGKLCKKQSFPRHREAPPFSMVANH
ncbi:MAG: hypothetical protein HYX63_21170 [Gammaproteobacteria bacterium]|nr:hypothetical protein [Gammaproteobacteria bacterium]